jgi:cobalamin biosynthesis protein CobT
MLNDRFPCLHSFTPQRILKADAVAAEPEGMWGSRDKEGSGDSEEDEESGSEEEEEEEEGSTLTRAQIRERKAQEARQSSKPGQDKTADDSDDKEESDTEPTTVRAFFRVCLEPR